ncbi:hypothetical protein Taro_038376 [Colocasia esculenta]|uniref:Magnesium transporter CorA-like family protein n=1 Tax=Colocasia esculenta TaxID=4460 RepID=A0A843WJ31_COLES|nr:hypothetical protein [Colocasia esculenta]
MGGLLLPTCWDLHPVAVTVVDSGSSLCLAVLSFLSMDEKTLNRGEDNHSSSSGSRTRKQEVSKQHAGKEPLPGSELWTDGLICAFEFFRGQRYSSPSKTGPRNQSVQHRGSLLHKSQASRDSRLEPFNVSTQSSDGRSLSDSTHLPEPDDASFPRVSEVPQFGDHNGTNSRYPQRFSESHWVPIGWNRIKELVQTVKVDGSWVSQPVVFDEGEDDVTVADLAAPYWERPGGPTWWCHVDPSHHFVNTWLSNAQWLHPAISVALRDESRLISERMKHLLYEVPVRVAGGLLFELLGQSVGDPFRDEDDIPIVVRSWYAQNFLVTVLHVKGCADNVNVLGITEVQELLYAGGSCAPKSVHEVIAHLASRLSRWDDR